MKRNIFGIWVNVYHFLFVLLAAHFLVACQPIQPQAASPTTPAALTETPQATQEAQEDLTVLPNPASAPLGTWSATITKEDLLRIVPDFPPEYLCENSGTFVWHFKEDGTFEINQTALEGCPSPVAPHIEDTWEREGNSVTFAKGTPDEEVYELTVEGDLLTFTYVSGECIPCMAINTANPWQWVPE